MARSCSRSAEVSDYDRIIVRTGITLGTCALIGFVLFSKAGAGPLPPLARSISASRQFIVYGSDASVRGALCQAGERMKATLLALLQQPDHWKTPILVNTHPPQANLPDAPRIALYFNQTGFGLKLQLDLVIGPDMSGPAVERELLRTVVLELMYRARPDLPPGTTFVQPPDWLLDGVLTSTAGRGPFAFAEILKSLVPAKKIMPLEQFLSLRPELLDSPSRQLFSAYSFALIALLTNGSENRSRLARYISDLPDSQSDLAADLRAHFSVLGATQEMAEKTWSANIARISANRYRSLSIAETEGELDALLHPRFPELSLQSCRLEDYPRFLRLPSRVPVLNRLSTDLMLLGTRANPIYRPIVLGYQEIVSALARKKTHRIASRLDQLANARKETGDRMEKIDDYLNWFEATQSQTRSEAFAEYLKVAGRSDDPEPRRHDAISLYLDMLQTQFQ